MLKAIMPPIININYPKKVKLKYQYDLHRSIILIRKYSPTFIHLVIQNSYRTLSNEINGEINIAI